MVRETRHLWVGNLPDNIREDRIRDHFKRYGRVQNVKLLGRTESGSTITALSGGSSGVCATVAFMDIKSASKAHNAEHVLDERTLTTEYYEPAAIPSSAGAPSAGSSPAGSGYSGSSSSVNSTPAPASVSRYHLSGGEESTGSACPIAATAAAPANWRGTNDSATDYCRRGNTPAGYGRYQRNNSSNAPYATPPSNVDRTTTPHHRWYASGTASVGGAGGATGGESTPSTPGGGTEGGGRRRRHSGSGSSRSESSSPEPSDTSRASTPAAPPPAQQPHVNHRTPPAHQYQWASTANGRPLAICVRNLPTRSTDSSLKDGLYHEYKKHGKVMWVKVVGQNADRYAVVRFKKPSDVEKALEVSQDKLFFGCKISVAPHQSSDEDADSAKPYETDIDEYHPKATRTLFIGNLEKDVTQQQLRDKFKHFGRIIEIDIKKGSGGGAGYAFCQYASISSVVEAIRSMDGEYVGGSRVKLGFGKPVATTCVWVDGLTEHTEKQVLGAVARCGAATSVCVDRAAGAALVHFEQAAAAGAAVRELRRVAAQASAAEPDHPRLCVDYASRECQEAFYEQLEKHGGSTVPPGERIGNDITGRYLPSTRHDPLRYDGCGSRSRASSYGRGSSRTPRYPAPELYDPADYTAERRYRVYDELGSSPQTEDPPYEDRLQSVVVSPHRARRHRRDSSPEDRKHSKERHRSAGGSVVTVACGRRSRSGSRTGERHAGRRRHRRRRDNSAERGSRAGTPLRDEPDAAPTEPRRPPRERPPLPMSLPLPKFAAQLLRAAAPTPRAVPAPAPAPDSPPRPPSASSSSAGSAPHSPSLEERIRSLDEKYERWSGSRAIADAPERTRLRHRLLEVDINEVKPSEVVRSLLAKRSVFDEDSERLEGAARAPSPGGSPRCAGPTRVLRYPFPAHAPPPPPAPVRAPPPQSDVEPDTGERPSDPRLNRPDRQLQPERPHQLERLTKFNEIEFITEPRIRPRTPSTDRSQPDTCERRSPKIEGELDGDSRGILERRRRDSLLCGNGSKSCIDTRNERGDTFARTDSDFRVSEISVREKSVSKDNFTPLDRRQVERTKDHIHDRLLNDLFERKSENDLDASVVDQCEVNIARDIANILLKQENEDIKADSLNMDSPKELNSKFNEEQFIEPLNEVTTAVSTQSEVKNCDEKKLVISNEKTNIENEICTDILVQNQTKDLLDLDSEPSQQIRPDASHLPKITKEVSDMVSQHEFNKVTEKNGKERCHQSTVLEALHNTKFEKENIEFAKVYESEKYRSSSTHFFSEKKLLDSEKHTEDRIKSDREKIRHSRDRFDKDKNEEDKDKSKSNRVEKVDKNEKDRKIKEKVHFEKSHGEKCKQETERVHKDRHDRENERSKHAEEKSSRHDHHHKDKLDKDKRKDSTDSDIKLKKEEKHKHDKVKKESHDSKSKKDSDFVKSRKSSRDDISRDLCRKDSTDSSTSRASHESVKVKEEINEIKEESKVNIKNYNDLFYKQEGKDLLLTTADLDSLIKTEVKEERDDLDNHTAIKSKNDSNLEFSVKPKAEVIEKQRHYSVDSPTVDSKRKERLNSCSSLPPNIGYKRRMSSQDSLDSLYEDVKKSKNDTKSLERRDSKESKCADTKHKTPKFNKGHFAKLIESKTKDDKKNQVKPPDDDDVKIKEEGKDQKISTDRMKSLKKSPKANHDEKASTESSSESLHNDLDFLATLELRSSEEDEKQRALRKEMKEKKRIQQLQQIQALQMQQDALHQAELMTKLKDDKKQKCDDKKKEAAREKRMSTDRKSRDEKIDLSKRKNRKQLSTDSSDSDEPKKHSIFDIVDDGPIYISMYDKVKARSCKNMQKQEEEKRQEKIKAKFSQLKQSRAKREEKKRSSWDEDSDSEQDQKKTQKSSVDSSTDDDHLGVHNRKRDKLHRTSIDFDRMKANDYFSAISNEEDSRNKLSRKNSRTRIMSDTSDDETANKRSISRSPTFITQIKKEMISDSDCSQRTKDDVIHLKESSDDKIKRNSLLNLFGKSDSDDSKLKSSIETDPEYKHNFSKSISHDFSSESESMISNRISLEIRKKHKRKQKKHKSSFSDDEIKLNDINDGSETKHKNSERLRRHSNKKEKRKDKIRDSVDTDDTRDDKIRIKKDKKTLNNSFDFALESMAKKEGKMEDIFGPLSDESDKDTRVPPPISKLDYSHNYEYCASNDQLPLTTNCDESKFKERDENKRKKEKRRRDKRYIVKDDENSLDVDAVSKAIEARLIEDAITDDENRSILETLDIKNENNYKNDISENNKINNRHIEKLKKDCREKKKKKKRSREQRQSRKEHHHYHHHHDKIDKNDIDSEKPLVEISNKTLLLDIPLPNEAQPESVADKLDDCKSLTESPSLPRLTESPPAAAVQDLDSQDADSCSPGVVSIESSIDSEYLGKKIEVDKIPMPPPIECDISEVPLPSDPIPIVLEPNKKEITPFASTLVDDIDNSENAVRSISNLSDASPTIDKVEAPSKADKKVEEKPRAIISQEETEDAVAALLGESFGGKVDSFSDFEQVENNVSHQTETENVTIENENIPEEDAEEMRQAVQNLNASEMEMKPDTPVSDSDLLLIDTDTEEADETPQDAIERLPINIIATNQSLNSSTEQPKSSEVSNLVIAKPKTTVVKVITAEDNESNVKASELDLKFQLAKRETTQQQITSTATPVITSWTLSSNKLIDPHVLNIQPNQLVARDKSETKPTHITANIVQIKSPSNQNVQINSSTLRPIITPTRVSAPYQVINQMIRPQVSNMQPPTIKIPEQHILYQKSPGIVISPRTTNDPRLQSPKTTSQSEGLLSPRLTNMAILSTSQNLNPVGVGSPNIQQRSPGQVTVVRMQQPPLSPIQAMHLPHGARTMVSPSRPNSVLVQTQGAPIHFNRLPVTPVLAPISKQISVSNIVQQNKGINVSTSPTIHQQKIIATADIRKTDPRNTSEGINEPSKIILSPTSLQQPSNPTVMAQNRIMSMQNAMHVGNMNTSLHLPNKVLINNINSLNEKRENQTPKSEQHNHIPFGSSPIIHVAGVNHSTASIIQSGSKPVMCTLQEPNTINRGQNSNIIHTLNSPRLLTTTPITKVIQIDAASKGGPPSVLSMATIRSPTVLTRLESSNSVAVTTTSLTNVVMTPLLLKTANAPGAIRLTPKHEPDHADMHNHIIRDSDKKIEDKSNQPKITTFMYDSVDKHKEGIYMKNIKPVSSTENIAKCETDFEELLKDNTNEIKVTNDPEKKLEVNVGKTVTLITTNLANLERRASIDEAKREITKSKILPDTKELSVSESKEDKTNLSDSDVNHTESHTSDTKTTDSSKDFKATPSKPELFTSSSTETNVASKTSQEDIKITYEKNKVQSEETNIFKLSKESENQDNQMKNLDENDSWSAKDVNIDSVIKKVDSLCNETTDDHDELKDESKVSVEDLVESTPINSCSEKMSDECNSFKSLEIPVEIFNEISNDELIIGKNTTVGKRGGRNMRGKKSDKSQDRVQTRQISKPPRGTSTKRGRGRAKIDKKVKNLVNNIANNIPGDVYDFHEDSGDESATSPAKSEARPRLILTIKSPQSGLTNVTSSLSIKDQPKVNEKVNKEEKPEDFVSPSPNTRKSRRLQEKDVQRSNVDDVIDEVVKGSNKNRKRPTRQVGLKANQIQEKTFTADTRKSPRGTKRVRDRSLSDASLDSGDEKLLKKDEVKEPKLPRLVEPVAQAKIEPEPPATPGPAPAAKSAAPALPVQTSNPTPIMKPPKKMISEISAKLASAFEAAAAVGSPRAPMAPAVTQHTVPDIAPAVAPPLREPRAVEPAAADQVPLRGEPQDVSFARRLVDGVPGPLMPVGTDADARVQSPALPHRPPSTHRPGDRATPVLMRGGDGEGGMGPVGVGIGGLGLGAEVGAAGAAGVPAGAGASRGFRGAYAGPASLPRGAHHPPPHQPHQPHHHAKQVAVVSPHHPHPGNASRVTLTSVPSISPQGQMAMGDGIYPHFSHQHYQMYQQHFRATQHESRTTPSPYTRSLEAEGCEAPTPPLELRRPPSARVPRPAHSPAPPPADRLIMYAVGAGAGCASRSRSPPPAHGSMRPPAPPGALSGLPPAPPGPLGPPHASQVPREADSLQMLLRRYPVMWQGLLALKNDSAAVQMHFVGGNPGVAGDTLPRLADGSTPLLRIAQRMRLEPTQLDQVHRKMKMENEHCMLLALPCGRDHMDVLQQSTNLTAGFITYLQRKQAAGIVNVAPPGHHQAMFTVHIFPSCDFANENLNRIAPDLMHRVADIAHLLIVIATV